ncbi:hypothetical protein T484DRAFT_3022485 [Baffinella frigidus]|nr:hypothetical protein T484DRAFT_3022485 [Cryptophyta sp. CCMP2293]
MSGAAVRRNTAATLRHTGDTLATEPNGSKNATGPARDGGAPLAQNKGVSLAPAKQAVRAPSGGPAARTAPRAKRGKGISGVKRGVEKAPRARQPLEPFAQERPFEPFAHEPHPFRGGPERPERRRAQDPRAERGVRALAPWPLDELHGEAPAPPWFVGPSFEHSERSGYAGFASAYGPASAQDGPGSWPASGSRTGPPRGMPSPPRDGVWDGPASGQHRPASEPWFGGLDDHGHPHSSALSAGGRDLFLQHETRDRRGAGFQQEPIIRSSQEARLHGDRERQGRHEARRQHGARAPAGEPRGRHAPAWPPASPHGQAKKAKL